MPSFTVTAPDGTKYSIDAATSQEALEKARVQHSSSPSTSTASTPTLLPGIDPDYKSPISATAPGPPLPGIDADKPDKTASSSAGDFFKSILTGMAKPAAQLARGAQVESEQRAMAFGQPHPGPKVPTGNELVKAFNLHKPEGFWGEAGELTGEFLVNPLTYFGPGSAVGKFLSTAGAVFGGAAGKSVGGETGELVGAMGGGMTPAALRAATPILINRARQSAVQILESEGITAPTAGQRTGSSALEYWEGFLGDAPIGGGKATAARKLAGHQFTRAIMRRAMIDSDNAQPSVIDAGFKEIGAGMDAMEVRNTARLDKRFFDHIQDVGNNYLMETPEGNRRPIIGKIIDDVMERFSNTPVIPGEVVQHFRSRLTALQRNATNDPEYNNALQGLVNALDGAVQRSLTNPADVQAWRLLRRRYRNLMEISRASTGAAEDIKEGIITPSRMRQVLTSSRQGQRSYARGRGDFATLVHAGDMIMSPLPNSGTAQRMLAKGFATSLLLSIGYMLHGGEDLAAAGTSAVYALGPGSLGRLVMSEPVQKYLSNQYPSLAALSALRKQLPGAAATALRTGGPVLLDNPQSVFSQSQQNGLQS